MKSAYLSILHLLRRECTGNMAETRKFVTGIRAIPELVQPANPTLPTLAGPISM